MNMKSGRTESTAGIDSLLSGTAYRPVALIGRGSMGEVWSIRHEFMGRDFALKILHRRHLNNAQLIERLKFEARAIGALDHPNIVEITDFWVSPEGCPCLVMELLEGQRLDRMLLQRRRLPGSEVIEIGRQALSALSAAHAIGLVHRDIKPENLFVQQSPQQTIRLKLLDFGLARVVSETVEGASLEALGLTRTGTVLGSPRYMSPEGLCGERLGPEADIYSLGVVLYVCLVGLHSQFDFATSPVFHPPSQLGAIACPPALDTVLLTAVESDRGLRYATTQEFLNALDAAQSHVKSTELHQ